MDFFDERVLAALKDGKPRSFTTLLDEVGFSQNESVTIKRLRENARDTTLFTISIGHITKELEEGFETVERLIC
jgi:DNA-binding Lrp family transcriptional regulator